MKNQGIALLLMAFLPATLWAEVRLPAIISSHMVLQQQENVKLWGWSDAGENITIKTSWDTTTYTTKGDANAKWSMQIKTPAAGGPYTITIRGYNTLQLEDVMIGEVWIGSGQSNMEMNVNWGLKYDEDVKQATNQQIRFFYVPRTTALHPQEDVKARWVVCSPEEMKRFSAVEYFFGNKLQEQLHTPVGLINSSWGGTPAEVWTPTGLVNTDSALASAARLLKPSDGWPITPGATFNGMIFPLTNFKIKGAIWYQGESNVGQSSYQALFSLLINSWRQQWQQELPFYFVQIAPYAGYGTDNMSAAILREAQTKTLSLPHTGMVVTSDLVDDINDIHPKLKKEVGLRLANYALAETYGQPVAGYKSPQFKSMKIEKDKVRIYFDNADKGLMAKDGAPAGFYIAGDDKNFLPAQAKIEGNTILIWNKAVKAPVAVRFGFDNAAMPNVFSKEGLPVNLFRTEQP
jgi:sialate O-acetylesterase